MTALLIVLGLFVLAAWCGGTYFLGHTSGYQKGYRASEKQKYAHGDYKTAKYVGLLSYYQSYVQRLTKDVTFWQGKFRTVAHENNQLRKRLRKTNG